MKRRPGSFQSPKKYEDYVPKPIEMTEKLAVILKPREITEEEMFFKNELDRILLERKKQDKK